MGVASERGKALEQSEKKMKEYVVMIIGITALCLAAFFGLDLYITTMRQVNRMKTLAELKRTLVVGAKVKMIKHDWFPSGGLIGVERAIIRRQGNAAQFEGGSWLHFPSAKEISFKGDNKFSVILDQKSGESMTYEVIS